jgi:hypothetical protein
MPNAAGSSVELHTVKEAARSIYNKHEQIMSILELFGPSGEGTISSLVFELSHYTEAKGLYV